MATISEMLKTEDAAQQEGLVAQLLEMAQAPILTMTATLDTRTNRLSLLVNGEYTFDDLYKFLDAIRRDLNVKERDALMRQTQEDKAV